MIAIGLGLTLSGCVLLSLSQRRHYRRVFADESAYESRRLLLRAAGNAALVAALWPCIRAVGVPIGICLWLSNSALAAFVQIMVLTYRPGAAALSGALGAVLVVVGLAL